MPENWYDDRRNLVLMLDHMNANGYDVSELIRAVDKPWAYRDEFEQARDGGRPVQFVKAPDDGDHFSW